VQAFAGEIVVVRTAVHVERQALRISGRRIWVVKATLPVVSAVRLVIAHRLTVILEMEMESRKRTGRLAWSLDGGYAVVDDGRRDRIRFAKAWKGRRGIGLPISVFVIVSSNLEEMGGGTSFWGEKRMQKSVARDVSSLSRRNVGAKKVSP
jgi:hypothetical protein